MTDVNHDIHVSVPHYNFECQVPWLDYHDTPLSILFNDIVEKAMGFFNITSRPPVFEAYISGRRIQQLDAIVSTVMSHADSVTLLTNDEARDISRGQMYRDLLTRSMPESQDHLLPPLFRRRERQNSSQSSSRTDAYHGLFANRLQGGRAVDEQQHGDEEVVEPDILSNMRALSGDVFFPDAMRLSLRNFVNVMFRYPLNVGGAVAAEMMTTDNVKKVINLATFNRVCSIVTDQEISALTVPCEEAIQDTATVEEESDVIGGPQDAGLGACTICLSLLVNRIRPASELRKTPKCGHIFHTSCLEQWLTHNAITCPVCRESVVTDTKDYGYLGRGEGMSEIYTPADSEEQEETEPQGSPIWMPDIPVRPAVQAIARTIRRQ